MLRRRRLWVVLTALVFSTTWWLIEQPQRAKPTRHMTGMPFAPVVKNPTRASAAPASTSTSPLGAEPADATAYVELNSPARSPSNDLKIIGHLIALYLVSTPASDRVTLKDNKDVTRVLTEPNANGTIILPKSHPTIDLQGRLCDRWGTPYRFRPVSENSIEIRSAGPDRKLFTNDDLVAESAR